MTSITQVCCDLELARSASSSGGGSRSGAVLAASCGGCSLIFIGGAVVNVALAAIGRDLALESNQIQWIINAYMLTSAALTLLGGALGDRYGQRRIFLLGIALFGAASLGCAMSSDWTELVFFRLLQGVGEALILPAGLTILSGGTAYNPIVSSGGIEIFSSGATLVEKSATTGGPPLLG